jgi:hypothetical protein
MTQFLGRVARIVRLRSDLAAKKAELEDLVVQYIMLNPGVPWRKLAKRIRMDYAHLHKFAKSRGLVK